MPRICPICHHEVPESRPSEVPHQPRYSCAVCGDYRLFEQVAQRLFELTHYGNTPVRLENHYLISGVIRDRYERGRHAEVVIPDFDELFAAARPLDDPFESIDRILVYVTRSASRTGEWVHLNSDTVYPIAFARDGREFEYFLYLAVEIGLIESQNGGGVRPTPDGWRRLGQLRIRETEPDGAFVAMGFSEELSTAYTEGIEPALREAGFRAIRVDLSEHNGRIDDRIIADIRRSAVVVADFTTHRQNVYFEAGFAMGIGRHVIWTCNAADIRNAHFDTRQYNHVLWRDASDLRERLANRIAATIPRAGLARRSPSSH
jgi:hypothetical protein